MTCRKFLIALEATIFFIAGTTILIHAQTSSPNSVTPELLQQHGLHLPPSQTIRDLIKHQIDLPTHQELTVQWKSISGHKEPLPKQEADALPLANDFRLVERKQSVPNGVGRQYDDLSENTLVIVSATAAGEIKSLVIDYDQRFVHGEDLRPGKQPTRVDVVFPDTTLHIRIPDDPAVSRVVFFKPRYSGHWNLEQVGILELTQPNPKTW